MALGGDVSSDRVRCLSLLPVPRCDLQKLWLRRMLDLRHRADSESILPPLPVLDIPNGDKLTLGGGAQRTLRGHVRRMEALEFWARPRQVLPTTLALFIEYGTFLIQFSPPSVIMNTLSTVNFFAHRLRLPPVPSDPTVFALRDLAVQRMDEDARVLKEAIPVPFEVVKFMEEFVMVQENPVAVILLWQLLFLLMSSARFDDGLHVAPRTVELRPEGLQARAWQTKTDRLRKGTLLIIARASFSGQDWIGRGYQVWRKSAPAGYMEHDFFPFNTNGVWADFTEPLSYSAFVNNLRTFARLATSPCDALGSLSMSCSSLRQDAREANLHPNHAPRKWRFDVHLIPGSGTLLAAIEDMAYTVAPEGHHLWSLSAYLVVLDASHVTTDDDLEAMAKLLSDTHRAGGHWVILAGKRCPSSCVRVSVDLCALGAYTRSSLLIVSSSFTFQ